MKTTILAAVTALGLCLSMVAPAQAQTLQPYYYYTPNTGYVYGYTYPGVSAYTPYASTYVSPYTAAYYGIAPSYYNPYWTGYTPGMSYYNWNSYSPYTGYRNWQWYRRW